MSQISVLEEQYKTDMERQVSIVKQDSDNRVVDAVEKTKLEGKYRIFCLFDGVIFFCFTC